MRSIGIFSNTIHDKIKNWINGFTINMLRLQMERRAVGKGIDTKTTVAKDSGESLKRITTFMPLHPCKTSPIITYFNIYYQCYLAM